LAVLTNCYGICEDLYLWAEGGAERGHEGGQSVERLIVGGAD